MNPGILKSFFCFVPVISMDLVSSLILLVLIENSPVIGVNW